MMIIATVVTAAGLIAGGGTGTQAATTCSPGETALLAVVATTVAADRSSFPAWRVQLSPGDVVCTAAGLDPTYQDYLVRLLDGRDGIGNALQLVALPAGGLSEITYDERAYLALDEISLLPSYAAPTIPATVGAQVSISSTRVEGPAGMGYTARWAPVRLPSGDTGWVLDADLKDVAPAGSPSATPTPTAAASPKSDAMTPTVTPPAEAMDAPSFTIPTPWLILAAVAAGAAGIGALLLRRRKRDDPAADPQTEEREQ